VRANLRAATTPHVGAAYNVGTGESVTVASLAERIRDLAGSSSSIRYVDGREGDIRHGRAGTTAARERLGFDADVPLAEGLTTVDGL
jgi:UDP-glucose 4-epimerase